MPARIEVSARAEVLGISVGPFPGSHLFTTRLIYLSLPRSNGERSIGWGSPPATPVPGRRIVRTVLRAGAQQSSDSSCPCDTLTIASS
jgi:hypothetical protein